ncbi:MULTISPECIES: HAD-IIB family hydrolase [Niastella]|uniref:HAD-IIB family hydrolase n=1 Tax=Niastella soli TaxID=2821487 RepID=A0ABS3YXY0_9BACT|nr:HAD-IIB family hydrolase [Niastella soli]MBO9202270.1 HAD-IIB family hydrolase [Niastella soli]
MRYLCLAADYDGTLATHGKVEQEVIDALYRFKASTRQLILVTGRVLDELKVVFPEYELFDRIVAENGALLYNPATKEERLLGERPPASFINELHHQVKPLSVGKVILATWEPHHITVLEAIKKEGLELQVIFNKGAVMILPAGINKAKGLKETLKELNMSLHNVVAVGDAENDGAMLQAAECAVAVSNALPAVQHLADWVTGQPHGKGVIELIDRILKYDLQHLDCRLTRHYLCLGQRITDEDFSVCPYGPNILLSGTTKSGKSTMAAYILEKLLEKNYQFCLIDPEGDYLELHGGAVRIGDTAHAPSVEEVLSLLANPLQSVIVCILAIPLDDRPRYFNNLLTALSQMRKETGHPHWIIADEAHHMLPAPAAPSYYAIPDDFKNFIFISISTEGMNEAVLNKITLLISMGDDAAKSMEEFSRLRNMPLITTAVTPLQKGQAWVWDIAANNEPVLIKTGTPVHLLQRHKKKYARGDMDYNSFYFRGPENKMNLKAYNLMVFTEIAAGIDEETWRYHLKRKDYSNWLRHSVHDEELASMIDEIENNEQLAQRSRQTITDLINERYTA